MNHIFALLLLISTAVSVLANDWVRTGDEAFVKFQVEEAIAAYRAAIKENPSNYEATWKLARSISDKAQLMEKSDKQKKLYLEAQSLAQQAIALNPQDSKGYLFRAIAEGKVGLFEGGKKKVELGKNVKTQAEKAIALNPQEDLAYHVMGIWHREMATLNGFLKFFAQLIYGQFPPASLDESAANFKQAIELNGEAVAHHVELGLTYIEQKNGLTLATHSKKPSRFPNNTRPTTSITSKQKKS